MGPTMTAACCLPRLRRALWLLPALAILATGCIPNVTWLPDGSGFVLTEKLGRRLVHFDLKTKERRVIAEDTKTRTMWPAVSPDGKRVAAAHWLREKDHPDRLQVVIYRLGAGEEWRSTSFKMESSRSSTPEDGDTFLIWGSANHILVATRQAAWYDVKKDELIPIDECSPYTTGGASMRPDGKGFLALRREDAAERFVLVDLAGKLHTLPGELPKGEDEPLYPLRWRGNVAVLSGPKAKIEIDTDQRTVRRLPPEIPTLLPPPGKLITLHLFPGGKAVCCIYECSETRGGQQVTFHRVEWQEPGAKKRQVLLKECDTVPIIFPSRDRRRVAVRYAISKEKQHVMVIDATGKAVAGVDVNN